MSPDRTAPTTLRPALAPRSGAPEAPADGFAALLGAADNGVAPAGDERRGDDVRLGSGSVASQAGESAPFVPGELPSQPAVAATPPHVVAPPAPVEAAAPAAAAPLPGSADMPQPAPSSVVPVLGALAATVTMPPDAPDATPPPPAATRAPTPIIGAPVEPAPAPAATAPVAVPLTNATTPPAEAKPTAEPALSMPTAPSTTPPAPSGRGAGTAGEQGTAPREQHATGLEAPAPAAPAPQTSSAPAPPAVPAPLAQTAAPLHQAPRAVKQVLELALERGIAQAKLNLRPAELGGIEIRLQTSAAGVTAQVIADSPEAARLLHQAADDLRRSLERHDVTLLSLDVSTTGDGRPDASADPARERERLRSAHGLDLKADEPTAVLETVQLPDGLHVDVLA
jgi:hypothetical protein